MPPSRSGPEGRTKRRRRVYACDSCYRKKIKCDGTLPRCDWCYHHSIPCTYTRNQEVASLGSPNAQEQERRDTPSTPASDTSFSLQKGSGYNSTPEIFYTPPGPQPLAPQGFGTDICFAGQSLGNICGFNGLPFFSPGGLKWIRERTGDDGFLDSYSSGAPHVWPPTETRDEHESRERVELPNKKVIRQHLEAYQISIHGQLFPFLNPPCFEHTIRAAYDEELSDLSPSVKCARGCIFGFMAMASYLTVPPREDAIMSADKYAREVQDLLPDISREPVNLDGLQAVIMLCFCCTALSGDVFKMELLLSWAVRYIFHLKGNLYPTIAKSDHAHAKLHVRNLFWICFIQDKFFGLRTGLTPLFDPMNCELTLPGGEHGHCDPRSFHPSHQQKPSAFITLIRLSIVQSEIYRGLYSCPALRQSDAELLGTIRRLDSALEEWWSSVPVFTDDIHNDPTMADLLFKMQYHYCMAAIHQTSSRCTAWVRNQDTRAAGSSLAISIGASRAVLNRFLDTSPQLLGQFVMFCLPELTTSNIHLFSNILTNPLDRASWTDLELMRVTSRHVEDHLWQQAPASFTAQVRLAERFMGDLQRLASCAIVKAQRERGVDRVMGEG